MGKLLLEVQNLRCDFGLRTLLEIPSLEIRDGERVGLIGENGSGKSTLLAILSGERLPDEGRVARHGEIAVIHQTGDTDAESGGRLRSAFSAQPYREGLSGGERTRRRIAAALSQNARLLLADEPTTDLDAQGVAQLTRELEAYDGAIVLVSHDRALLDRLCGRILHLEDAHIVDFPGPYSAYRAELERRRAFQRFEYDQYRGEQARLKASIQGVRERQSQMKKTPKRMGNSEARLHKMDSRQTSAQLHKARRQMETRMAQLEVKERPREDVSIRMELGASRPVSAKLLLELRALTLTAGGKTLLKVASARFPTGSRTAILGPNGCGKTTLMRTIAGRAAANGQLCGGAPEETGAEGSVRLNPGARVGWFDQTHERTLDLRRTALENALCESCHPESDVRTVLARLGLRGDDVFKPVGVLSGGERGRVALAKLLLSDANLLLLDEPTNHLDIFTLEALQEMLASYRGTVAFVSHDQAFCEAVATRTLAFENLRLESAERRESVDRAVEDARVQISVLQMRMATLAARMAAPQKGDDPRKLNEDYLTLAEQLRALRS